MTPTLYTDLNYAADHFAEIPGSEEYATRLRAASQRLREEVEYAQRFRAAAESAHVENNAYTMMCVLQALTRLNNGPLNPKENDK